jgi:hypothetical protein
MAVNVLSGNDRHFLSSYKNPKLKSIMKISGPKEGADVAYLRM